MTTKNELIAQFNAENPEIVSTINGETITLDIAEYEKTRDNWVTMRLEQFKVENEIAATQASKIALLSKLGITAEEATLLLG